MTMIATHDTLTEARSVSIQPKPGNNTDICLCAANNAHVSACTHVNLQLCVLSRDNLSLPNSRLLTAWTHSFLKMFNRNHFTCSEYKNTRNSCADSLSISLSLSVSLSLMVSPSLSLTLSARRTDGQTTDRHTDTLTRPGTVAHKHKVGVPEHPRNAVERAKTISRRKPYVSVC